MILLECPDSGRGEHDASVGKLGRIDVVKRSVGQLLRVPARVAWVRMEDDFCGMGVAFEPNDSNEREAVEKLLGQLEKKNS